MIVITTAEELAGLAKAVNLGTDFKGITIKLAADIDLANFEWAPIGYGPNAAGKTNIVGAMDVFRAIVLQGNIRNSEEKASPNAAATALGLIEP